MHACWIILLLHAHYHGNHILLFFTWWIFCDQEIIWWFWALSAHWHTLIAWYLSLKSTSIYLWYRIRGRSQINPEGRRRFTSIFEGSLDRDLYLSRFDIQVGGVTLIRVWLIFNHHVRGVEWGCKNTWDCNKKFLKIFKKCFQDNNSK